VNDLECHSFTENGAASVYCTVSKIIQPLQRARALEKSLGFNTAVKILGHVHFVIHGFRTNRDDISCVTSQLVFHDMEEHHATNR